MARTRIAPHQLLTIAQTAERLGVHQATIRRWIADGRLTGYRIGPQLIRLDEHEVEGLLQPIPTAGRVSA